MLSNAPQLDQHCLCLSLLSLAALRGAGPGLADVGAHPHLRFHISLCPLASAFSHINQEMQANRGLALSLQGCRSGSGLAKV